MAGGRGVLMVEIWSRRKPDKELEEAIEKVYDAMRRDFNTIKEILENTEDEIEDREAIEAGEEMS
jgi:hypothetical protein